MLVQLYNCTPSCRRRLITCASGDSAHAQYSAPSPGKDYVRTDGRTDANNMYSALIPSACNQLCFFTSSPDALLTPAVRRRFIRQYMFWCGQPTSMQLMASPVRFHGNSTAASAVCCEESSSSIPVHSLPVSPALARPRVSVSRRQQPGFTRRSSQTAGPRSATRKRKHERLEYREIHHFFDISGGRNWKDAFFNNITVIYVDYTAQAHSVQLF